MVAPDHRLPCVSLLGATARSMLLTFLGVLGKDVPDVVIFGAVFRKYLNQGLGAIKSLG